MTFILCIDTSLRGVSAALVNTEDADAVQPAWLGAHLDIMSSASQITELINQGLRDARVTAGEVGGLAVSVGPGSFTGIKIGLSFAAGFTFGRRERCGILGISALECALATKLAALKKDGGVSSAAQLFLAATKTHGFVCRADAKGDFSTSLVDLANPSATPPELPSSGSWTGVIGDWATLENLSAWQGSGAKKIPVEQATHWALHGMIDCAVKQWPEGFGKQMPEPRYMRLSTAEEKKQADLAKEPV